MMRLALCFSIVLAGCSSDNGQQSKRAAGWTMSRDKYRNAVFYRFADKAGTRFIGICDSRPVFGLYGGDYPTSSKFTLRVDGKNWEIAAFDGADGRSLPIFEPLFAEIFRNAKWQITFRVGKNWVRSFTPSPLLKNFVDECRAMRLKDPDALGI
jgi:hypothetical protein